MAAQERRKADYLHPPIDQLDQPIWDPLRFTFDAIKAGRRLRHAQDSFEQNFHALKILNRAEAIVSEQKAAGIQDNTSLVELQNMQAKDYRSAEKTLEVSYNALQGMLPGLRSIAGSNYYGNSIDPPGDRLGPHMLP